MKKRILYFLAAILLFCISVFGANAMRLRRASPVSLSLTVRVSHCDNALADIAQESRGAFSLNGISAVLHTVSASPSQIFERENGKVVRYASKLFSDLTFSFSLEGEKREYVFYANEKILSPGNSISFSSPFFCGSGVILSVSPTFS